MTKILLADDSVTIQKVVELTFSDGESKVMAFGDGASALENAQIDRPDIILSDVIMPGMNGYEFCRKVKSDPDLKTIPFLFLKGTFESFDEEKAKESGADGYIVKPFESQELISKVKELIKRASEGQVAAAEPLVSEQISRPLPAPAPVAPPPVAAPPPPPLPEPPSLLLQPTKPAAPEPAPAEMSPFELGGGMEEPAERGMPEEEDDLWSEVSLRESASPLMEDQVLEEESFWGTAGDGGEQRPENLPASPVSEDFLEEVQDPDILDLADEAGLDEEPLTFPEERPSLDDVTEKGFDPVETTELSFEDDIYPAHPEALELSEEALPPAAPPAAGEAPWPEEHGESKPSTTGAELERLVGARIEEAVSTCLGPVIAETARKIIEEVAWEVIPDLAEAMIKSEIEKIKQKERKSGGV